MRPLRGAAKVAAKIAAARATAAAVIKAPVETPVKKVAPPAPRAPAAPIAIARREKQQLARGRVAIDARIDLHGLTQAQAHGALLRFLHRSQAEGAKFVLVITGKGAPGAASHAIAGTRGVLRQQVPLWFGLPEFRACVLGFDVAHVGHGGDGALYVRLRRSHR